MSKFCMYSFSHLTSVPAVVYNPAVGHMALTSYVSTVYRFQYSIPIATNYKLNNYVILILIGSVSQEINRYFAIY